jgi:transcriptional regulator with XRE-family HTH domain
MPVEGHNSYVPIGTPISKSEGQMMSYHYGQTIKEYRLARKMTLEQLAARWPSKETGVNVRYVIDVEGGKKKITDVETLRKIATLLTIPLWKFGLNEYDPFHETDSIGDEFRDSEALQELIQNIWYIRLYAPLEVTEQKIIKLSNIFSHLISENRSLWNNKDFLVCYAQIKRLEESMYTEKHDYTRSMSYSREMLDIAKLSGNTKVEAIALVRVGIELLRGEDREAIDYLEQARDVSFSTSSKEVAAYCYSMLARGYVTFGDEKRFLQAITTAINLAESMKGLPVTAKDNVFHAYSAILEERLNGLILLGKGKQALNGVSEVEEHVEKENNSYLKMWLPLDYAQSFLAMNEVEESMKWLGLFYNSIKDYKSARLNSSIKKHLKQLDDLGYADVSVVKSFRKEYDG